MPNENLKILSYSMVSSALLDPGFYELFPEFTALKPKLDSLNVDLRPGRCSGCQKKRIEANLFKDFSGITQSLSENKLQKLKEYYKLDKLMLNIVNTATGEVKFKTI